MQIFENVLIYILYIQIYMLKAWWQVQNEENALKCYTVYVSRCQVCFVFLLPYCQAQSLTIPSDMSYKSNLFF